MMSSEKALTKGEEEEERQKQKLDFLVKLKTTLQTIRQQHLILADLYQELTNMSNPDADLQGLIEPLSSFLARI